MFLFTANLQSRFARRAIRRERAHLAEANPRRIAELQVHTGAHRHAAFPQSQRLTNRIPRALLFFPAKKLERSTQKINLISRLLSRRRFRGEVEPAEQPNVIASILCAFRNPISGNVKVLLCLADVCTIDDQI